MYRPELEAAGMDLTREQEVVIDRFASFFGAARVIPADDGHVLVHGSDDEGRQLGRVWRVTPDGECLFLDDDEARSV